MTEPEESPSSDSAARSTEYILTPIFVRKIDHQFCLQFPQHQFNVTTGVVETLSSSRKQIKNPESGKSSIADLLGGLSTIRTNVSADIFYANTNGAHQHEEASDNYGKNYRSSVFT